MQEFATGTSYGQIGRDQAQQERDPWLLTPLSSMRPHSAARTLAKRPEKEKLPRTRGLVQPYAVRSLLLASIAMDLRPH